MSKLLENIDYKKLAIMALPILLIGCGLIMILTSSESEEENIEVNNSSLLLPESEHGDSINSKTYAYDLERETERKNLRNEDQNVITQRDFFARMNAEEPSVKSEKDEDLDELFEELKSNNTRNSRYNNDDDYIYENRPKASTQKKNTNWTVEKAEPIADPTEKRIKEEKPTKVEYQETESTTGGMSDKIKGYAKNSKQKSKATSRFFSVGEDDEEKGNLTLAVIDGTQVVKNGEDVHLRLLESMQVGNITIPEQTTVVGVVRFTEARVNISITAIKLGKNLIPVEMAVFDNTGLIGLPTPESLKSDFKKIAEEEAVNKADIPVSSDNNIITGTVGAVVNTGKSVFRKKRSELSVELKSNKIYIQ